MSEKFRINPVIATKAYQNFFWSSLLFGRIMQRISIGDLFLSFFWSSTLLGGIMKRKFG